MTGPNTHAAPRSLVLPSRFNGPPGSGNGGYAAGALAATLRPRSDAHDRAWTPVTVSLRRPPPLDTALDVTHGRTATGSDDGGSWAEAFGAGELVARAEEDPSASLEQVPAVGAEEARAAQSAYPGLTSHPFPTCFSCGTDREEGDGLRIFPGPVDPHGGRPRVAATWTPHPSVAEDWHECRGETPCASLAVTWAALDCVSAWASGIDERPMVLARMTARVDRLPVIGAEHVVAGISRREEGRKNFAAASLYDASGGLVATAEHLWITVDPATF